MEDAKENLLRWKKGTCWITLSYRIGKKVDDWCIPCNSLQARKLKYHSDRQMLGFNLYLTWVFVGFQWFFHWEDQPKSKKRWPGWPVNPMTGASALCGWGTCSVRWSWVQAEGSTQRYQVSDHEDSCEFGGYRVLVKQQTGFRLGMWFIRINMKHPFFFLGVFELRTKKSLEEWFWWRLISILVVDLWSWWNIAHTYLIHLTTHGGWWPLQTCWF